MTTKHTPAPWTVEGDNHTLIGGPDGKMMLAEAKHEHIVPRWCRTLKEAQANARLIAAAPELAEALALMVSRTEQYEFGGMFGQYGTTKELLAMARAALAKAGIT